MQIERKITAMGIDLFAPPAPQANFVPTVQTGNLLFVAGHLPRLRDGSILNRGKVGREVTAEQGYAAARQAMVNCLASVKAGIGDLDRVNQVVKLLVMVNADLEFDQHFAGRMGRRTCWWSCTGTEAGTPGRRWAWAVCPGVAAWRWRWWWRWPTNQQSAISGQLFSFPTSPGGVGADG